MTSPYTMSIETTEGNSHQHGFHLGTIEPIARQLCEERFHGRVKADMPTVTIALMRNGRIVDVYYGNRWHND